MEELRVGSTVSLGSRLPLVVDYLFYGTSLGVVWWVSRLAPHGDMVFLLLGFAVVLTWAFSWRQLVSLTSAGFVVKRGIFRERSVSYGEIKRISWVEQDSIQLELDGGDTLILRAYSPRFVSRLARLEKVIRREAGP